MRVIIIVSLFFLLSCKKQYVESEEVIYGLTLSPDSVDADGSSIISVSANVSKDADASKRKIVFETSSGSFTSNGIKAITLEAVYENGLLVARTTMRSPSSPGSVVVSARPENRNPYNDFIAIDSVQAIASAPTTIKLEPSAFSVSTAFIGEVQITGTLRNAKNRNVSTGNKVLFEDIYLGGATVNGRYRLLQTSSDESSKVSTYYSPGHLPPGTSFYIRCAVLDNAGNKTSIKDSILLTVIP